jgi:hypothetical protein
VLDKSFSLGALEGDEKIGFSMEKIPQGLNKAAEGK